MCCDRLTHIRIAANSRELFRKIGLTFEDLSPADKVHGLSFAYLSIKPLTAPGLTFTIRNRYLFHVLHAVSCCCPAGCYAGYLGEGEILVVLPHCGADVAATSMETAAHYLSRKPEVAADGVLRVTYAVGEAGEALVNGGVDFTGLVSLLRQRVRSKDTRPNLAAKPG